MLTKIKLLTRIRQKLLAGVALMALCCVVLTIAVSPGRTQLPASPAPRSAQPLSTDCAIQPGVNAWHPGQGSSAFAASADNSTSLERFRRVTSPPQTSETGVKQALSSNYTPSEEIALIHPTNYGDRFLRDIYGQPADHRPIVVLHETVASASSTVNFFRTPHWDEDDQANYHTLIRRDGAIVYLVPPDKRAFGAGNSVFVGDRGNEAVKTHPTFPASVNNFAYHISLETPADGMNNDSSHSGYTDRQYQSLAWLVAKTGIAADRITTHQAVDRSGSRIDPRSFQAARFFQLVETYPRVNEIPLQCTSPPSAL